MTLNPGPSVEDNIRLDAEVGELARLTAWLDGFCERHSIPEEPHYHLNIAVEELVLNAIKHGRCSPSQGAIQIRLRLSGPELDVTITDTGIPFNPLDAPPPDLTSSLADRPIGGLGVHLVRSLMNSVEYKRVGGENQLRLRKDL
jgi:anti-sigma regulatory factor (Ser/Thr protein kinase)